MGNRRRNFRIIEGAGLYCQPIFFNRSEDQRRSAVCTESSFRIMGRFKERRFTLRDFEFVLLNNSSRCDNASRPSLAHPAMAIQILRFCRRHFVPNGATKATPCPGFHVDPHRWPTESHGPLRVTSSLSASYQANAWFRVYSNYSEADLGWLRFACLLSPVAVVRCIVKSSRWRADEYQHDEARNRE